MPHRLELDLAEDDELFCLAGVPFSELCEHPTKQALPPKIARFLR